MFDTIVERERLLISFISINFMEDFKVDIIMGNVIAVCLMSCSEKDFNKMI